MVIDGEDQDDDAAATDVAGTAFRDLQKSVDGFTRTARGKAKFNKDTKKRRREEAEDDDGADEIVAPTKAKRKVQRLGQEFKAKVFGPHLGTI